MASRKKDKERAAGDSDENEAVDLDGRDLGESSVADADGDAPAKAARRARIRTRFVQVRPLLVPVIASALVGMVAVAALVGAFHDYRTHGAPVAIAADEASVAEFERQVGTGSSAPLEVSGVPAGVSPRTLIERREAYAVLVVSPTAWQLQYAGANGRMINTRLAELLRPGNAEISFSTTDVRPAASGDESGLSVFAVVLAVGLTAFLFGLLLARRADAVTAGVARWVLAVFGLVLGVTAMLVTRFVFDALDGNGILPALLLALLAFVVAGLTTALVRMWSVIGAAIAGFALVVLGVVFSGALMPPEFLPTFLQPLVAIAPFGMATQGVIGASYFENADVDLGLFGLIAWAILAGVLLVVAERRQALAVEA